MTITQDILDDQVLTNRKNLDKFLLENSRYFEFCGRINPNTNELYYPNDLSLDRESTRLFFECRKANKAALDFEYASRTTTRISMEIS